jgi:hypothetical protein
MGGFDWLAVSVLFGNILGWFLKNKTDLTNKLIPYFVTGFMALKNVLVAAGLLPTEATVLGTTGAIGSTAMLGIDAIQYAWIGSVGWFILSTLLDAALPVGLHSIGKNSRQLQESIAKKASRAR